MTTDPNSLLLGKTFQDRPDSTHLQTETTAQQLLCPPVVAQTRPMEGCNPVLPRRLRRSRDVLMEDGAVDTRQVSAASETVVSREIHRKSECVPTVVPTLAAAPQTASEVVQPRPRDSGCTDSLPPVGECLESLRIDTPDARESVEVLWPIWTFAWFRMCYGQRCL